MINTFDSLPFLPYSQDYFSNSVIPFLERCHQDVPFYVNHPIHSVNSYTDLSCLPLLTKRQLRSAFPKQILSKYLSLSPSLLPSYLSITRTSGSTGDRVMCLADHRISGLPCNNLSEFPFGSNSLEDIRLAVLSSPICQGLTCDLMDTRTYEQRISGPRQNILNLPIPVNLSHIDLDYLHQFQTELLRHRPNVLLVDPIYLYLITKSLLRYNLPIWQPRLIFYSYEFIPNNALTFLKSFFPSSHFRSYYAATELGGARIAIECQHGNLHCWPDHTLVEILDRNNNHCQPGEIGRVVVTNIINSLMPLIRYEIGDLASWSPQECPCSLAHWPIIDFHGRSNDSIFMGEKYISNYLLDSIISRHSSLEIYNMRFNTTSISISYPADDSPLSLIQEQSIANSLCSLGFTNIAFQPSLKLHPEPSRKFRLFRRSDD